MTSGLGLGSTGTYHVSNAAFMYVIWPTPQYTKTNQTSPARPEETSNFPLKSVNVAAETDNPAQLATTTAAHTIGKEENVSTANNKTKQQIIYL